MRGGREGSNLGGPGGEFWDEWRWVAIEGDGADGGNGFEESLCWGKDAISRLKLQGRFFSFFMVMSVFDADNERPSRVMESAASGVVSFDTGAGEIRQDYEA